MPVLFTTPHIHTHTHTHNNHFPHSPPPSLVPLEFLFFFPFLLPFLNPHQQNGSVGLKGKNGQITDQTVYQPGMHWILIGDGQFYLWPTSVQIALSTLVPANSSDSQPVPMNYQLPYTLIAADVYQLYQDQGLWDSKPFLQAGMQAALQAAHTLNKTMLEWNTAQQNTVLPTALIDAAAPLFSALHATVPTNPATVAFATNA